MIVSAVLCTASERTVSLLETQSNTCVDFSLAEVFDLVALVLALVALVLAVVEEVESLEVIFPLSSIFFPAAPPENPPKPEEPPSLASPTLPCARALPLV